MSYHARIAMPLLIVTGITGACGNRKRIGSAGGSPSCGTTADQPWPIVAETVQPDHGRCRIGAGFDFDRGKQHLSGHGRKSSSATRVPA